MKYYSVITEKIYDNIDELMNDTGIPFVTEDSYIEVEDDKVEEFLKELIDWEINKYRYKKYNRYKYNRYKRTRR